MPEINFNQAKEFLDNITSEDKVAIIHHDDLDGFASGILFYDWCKNRGVEAKHFTFDYKEWDDQTSFEEFDKILIADIAPSGVEYLNLPLDKEILYTDHHPKAQEVPKELLSYQTVDEGYIPSSRTVGELTGIKKWLSIAGTIADAGDLHPINQEFIDNFLKEIKMSLDKFRENVTSIITNTLVYFNKDPDKAFEILKEINSIEEIAQLKKYSEPVENEVQKFVEEYESKKEKLGNINLYCLDPHYYIKKPVAAIISRNNPDDVIIFVIPWADGSLSLSGRNHSRKKDVSRILREGIKGLENAKTGGHTSAAGGKIQTKDLEKFKQNIRDFVEQ